MRDHSNFTRRTHWQELIHRAHYPAPHQTDAPPKKKKKILNLAQYLESVVLTVAEHFVSCTAVNKQFVPDARCLWPKNRSQAPAILRPQEDDTGTDAKWSEWTNEDNRVFNTWPVRFRHWSCCKEWIKINLNSWSENKNCHFGNMNK